MEIKIHKCHNSKAEIELNPNTWIQETLGSMDGVIKYLTQFKPDLVEKYIQHLSKRVKKAIETIKKKDGFYDFPADAMKLEFLDKYPDLRKLVVKFFLRHMNPMKKSTNDPEKYIVYGLNQSMAFRRISYHRVKTFTELLGKIDGIKLYTKILSSYIEEMTKKYPQSDEITVKKQCEKAIKSWCSIGMADFVSCVLDEHMIHFRFDSCFAHDALKDFNDPDIAYYASCYGADLPAFNKGRIIHLRRSQTLHHADFCDELYWDSREYEEPPEQPTIEFTKNMGNEKSK